MIRINLLDTELDLKIVITGPEGSGKTSFITYLYLNARRRFRSSLTSYNNLVGKTLFFDHLRLLYGKAGRKTIVLNIFTTPGADAINRRRDEVLEFADAVIFVFDPRETGGREARRFVSEVSRIAAAQKLPSSPDIPTIRYLNHKIPSQRSKKPHLAKLILKNRSPDFSGSILTGERVWETLDAAARGALLNRGAKKILKFSLRAPIPVSLDEFNEIYRTYHIQRGAFEYDRYVSLGKKVVKIDPSEKNFLLALADAFERDGKYEKARKYRLWAVRSKEDECGGVEFRTADEEGKNPIDSLDRFRCLLASRALTGSREYEKARHIIKRVVAGTADVYERIALLKLLAEIKIWEGKTDEGLNSLSRLASRFASIGYYRQALALYRIVLRRRPENLEVLLGIANVFDRMDRVADALSFYKMAHETMSVGRVFVGRSDVVRKIEQITRKLDVLSKARDGS